MINLHLLKVQLSVTVCIPLIYFSTFLILHFPCALWFSADTHCVWVKKLGSEYQLSLRT